MSTPKDLYSEVPPTRIRNREEKFRVAKNNPFWHAVADYAFPSMLKNRFHSIMYKGKENVDGADKRFATIFYATHNNWWDGAVGYYSIYNIFKNKRLRLMIEEMNRFPLFQYVGCFPVNKKSAQSAMKSLKYAVTTLKDPDIGFWLFPQGIIRPPYYRPETFQSGMAYLVHNAVKEYGGINIIPVGVKYTFLRQERPEVLIEYGKCETITDSNIDRKAFTHKIEREFEVFLDNQQAQIAKGNFDDYVYAYKAKLRWYRAIEHKLKNIGMKEKD